ncbi:redoxin domain-containing protein [Gemmatimonadota bacterium]
MELLRRARSLVRIILRFTVPPAIPLAFALITIAGISWSVHGRSAEFRSLHSEYWEARRRTGTEHPEKRQELNQALADYVQGPGFLPESTRRRASYYLFQLMREDPDTDLPTMRETIQHMLGPPPYPSSSSFAESAIALIEREEGGAEARRLAEEGLTYTRELVDKRRDDGRYDGDEAYERALNTMTADLYDARGWVSFQEGRLVDAELDLRRALDAGPENPDVLYHLGRLYQKKLWDCETGENGDDPDALRETAEDFYLRGTLANWTSDWVNPNVEALEALFLETRGSLEGFAEHFAETIEGYQEEKKEKVLARRHDDPELLAPFELENLAGGTLSSESLAGKVVVINFWGTWCVWCVKELPELQLFHEKYRDQDDVLVLTIAANDPNQEHVRAWMAERSYDYPVLWDGGYAKEAGVRGYPTTWFVDPTGNIAFTKIGTTWRLVEEWGWMVEGLLGDGPDRSGAGSREGT